MQTVLDKMMSQADKEGVTLADILARDLSPAEMNRVQEYIHREIAVNRATIEEFMSDIEVTGTFDFASMSEEELDDFQENLRSALSDTPLMAEGGV
ncbi:MAG: hypothetical protein JSV90_08565 [Methanobacteriota archaeon]|nr:MAG: hypothetical protein JSV90_08565 [Euryarchaeota archaeon]